MFYDFEQALRKTIELSKFNRSTFSVYRHERMFEVVNGVRQPEQKENLAGRALNGIRTI